MKIEFEVKEKAFTNEKGEEVKYWVISKKLMTGREISVAIKRDKAELLLMNEAVSKKN